MASGNSTVSSASEIHAFSVLGATGGSDVLADALLTDGTALTAQWTDTAGEDSYELKILDQAGSAIACGPITLPAETTSYTLDGCSLSHGGTYQIHVTARNSSAGTSQSAQMSFQVGPFISVGNLTADEWGLASVPVTLSYAMSTAVSVQYVTVDGSAVSGADYIHLPLSTLTIPSGRTSVLLPIPILTDSTTESEEELRIEFSSPSNAGLLTTSARVSIQDNDLAPAVGFSQVATGTDHTCALTSGGAAKCWGANYYGQLGDNSYDSRAVPTAALGLASGNLQVASGGYHSCALTSAGGVKCWGRNDDGQIGNNTTTDATLPSDVAGMSSGITQITTGGYHSCALSAAGGVACWGYNSFGQLGNNSTAASSISVNVTGLASGVSQIAAGRYHTCALTTAGGVKCWGRNNFGELGDNSITNRSVPTDVIGLASGITQVAAGDTHTCALSSTGAVKCWGLNTYGQLGDNSVTSRRVPTDVSGLSSGIAQVVGGGSHTCALTSAGSVQCWGLNSSNQLGNNLFANQRVPVSVSGLLSGITQITAGNSHTCALTSAGSIQCWGLNAEWQLGDNKGIVRSVPTDVFGLQSEVTQAAAGNAHTCSIHSDGSAKCWGTNVYGQLGNNSLEDSNVPVNVSGLSSGVTQIVTGLSHSCALTSAGGVKCWGRNASGQLGDNSNTNRIVPTDVFGLTSGIAQIEAGSSHTCAVTSTGAVKCWGSNSNGQLGDGTVTNRNAPTDVSTLASGVAFITAGENHSCALSSSGAVNCWGANTLGQVGDNSVVDKSAPVDVTGLSSGITQVTAGGYHTCALTSAGAVKCWGFNYYGQLGNNTTTDQIVPTDVFGLTSGISQIAAGETHTCVLTSSNGVKCWGINNRGNLGYTTVDWYSAVPGDVSGLLSGITQISTGFQHNCALTATGALKCWGDNSGDQIGDSYTNWVPQYVVAP